ncbi:MAG: hypothetical protein NVS1B2_05540 [Vulcanimicrobiaceae bacterium]
MQNPSLLMIEFNELCPSLLDRFMAQGSLPNFERFAAQSTVYRTDAGEAFPNLEPWIAWPSVHTGVPFREHGAFHLGDGRKVAQAGVARILADAGHRVGVFGSMNTNYTGFADGYYIPDPWDPIGRTSPDSYAPFYDFVAAQVRESSRPANPDASAVAFARFMMTHGLTLETIVAIVRQLVDERRDPGVTWRRALVLDRLQYDLFKHANAEHDVEFATFFSNSTAHFQHWHWRNMEPDVFDVAPDADDHASYATAILDGYRAMDAMLGRFMRDYPATRLVLATALSQQPFDETTKCVYRPHDFDAFLDVARVRSPYAVKPVMSEQFAVVFDDAETARVGRERMDALRIGGEPLLFTHLDERTVFAGCSVYDRGADVLERPVVTPDGSAVPLGSLFYRVGSMRSGRHHADGALWVRDGVHRTVDGHLPIEAIAPLILRHFGVTVPPHMRGDGKLAERPLAYAR